MSSNITHKNISIHGLSGRRGPASRKAQPAKKVANKPGAIHIVDETPESSVRPKGLFDLKLSLKTTPKVKLTTLHTFSHQLSVMLKSGMPLVGSLKSIANQSENKYLSKVITEIARDVNAGSTLTKAFSKFPKVFPNIFIAMLRAAELGGNIAIVLKQLSGYLVHQEAIAKKVKSATAYPKFVLGFFFLVVNAIIFWLVPKFKETFASFGAALPKPTQIMIDFSDFAQEHIWVECGLLIALVIAFKQVRRTTWGRAYLDGLLIRLPVVGEIFQKSAIAKFCRTLAIMIKSGVSIIEALEIAGKTTENVVFLHAFREIRRGLVRGETLGTNLTRLKIFPPLVINMISTGEQSGSLESMLNSVADIFDGDVDSRISSITSILEPALMVALGAVALVVILVLYLPIFYMGSVM